ncbi:MAG: hypothetical protein IPG72_05510 [Ardenticatenales bacterium]|nr:hypothetical protein [Ardenticatenales bacterium]
MNDQLTCGLGTLLTGGAGAGDTVTVVFEVITDSGLEPGSIVENDAQVTADQFDIDNSDNYVFTQNTVLAAADMGVLKSAVGEVVTSYNATLHEFIVTDEANTVTAGMILRYQIQVQNNGPSDGRNVTIQENLPTSPLPGPVTFLRADGAVCRPDDVNQQIVVCDLGYMVAGARKTFDIYVLVDPSVPTGTVLTNTSDGAAERVERRPAGRAAGDPGGGPDAADHVGSVWPAAGTGEHGHEPDHGERRGGRVHHEDGCAGADRSGRNGFGRTGSAWPATSTATRSRSATTACRRR